MHVDAVVARGQISKMHHHRVSYFRANDGAEDAEPFGLRLTLGKTSVCVLDKPGLLPLAMESPGKGNVLAVHQFQTAGKIIPIHLFRGNVVFPHVGPGLWLLLRKDARSTGQQKDGKQGNYADSSVLLHVDYEIRS